MAMIPFADQPNERRRTFPYVMVGLILLNVLVFIYELTLAPRQLENFVFAWGATPAEITTGQDLPPAIPIPIYFTLITSMFIHGGFLHIIGNMIFLWVFGDNVEDALGHGTFLLFYLLAGIVAGLVNALVLAGSTVPGIGASGAIAGVLAGYLVLFPTASVRTLLFFGPFLTVGRIAAVILIGFWFLLQIVQGTLSLLLVPAQAGGGVAFFAHIGGFLFGLVMVPLIRAARHERIGNLLGGGGIGRVFGHWITLVVVLGLLLGATSLLASAGARGLAMILEGLIILGVIIFAVVDAVRRISNLPSFLGPTVPPGRFLAFIQLLIALGLVIALFGAIL